MQHVIPPRYYTVYARSDDGALRPQADVRSPNAHHALLTFKELAPDTRGPLVVLPALTAAPLCVD